jgi:hypothetical protein
VPSHVLADAGLPDVDAQLNQFALDAWCSPEDIRAQAMTVSGLTMTSVVRHSVQTRDSQTQKTRSARESRCRRGRERSRTCSWCRSEQLKLERGA